VALGPGGAPVYRAEGSAGPADIKQQMIDLGVTALNAATDAERAAAELRYQERLRFLNLGLGGPRAMFDAAVVNTQLALVRGRYPDILSDMVARELPWAELGFSSYQDYLRALGYEDLGNGTWRRLERLTPAGLDVPFGGRGFAGSLAPGFSFVPPRGEPDRYWLGLVNWRI
jgi:hypothetical protein